ncbi:MAG: hypothetical protein ACEQSB_01595 [Undibacterium sp.]
MASKVLVINFTQKEVEKLSPLLVQFDRGFLSDVTEIDPVHSVLNSYAGSEDGNDDAVSDLDFYTPLPVYEYDAVFIKLHHQNLEDEFKGKTKKITKEDRDNFFKFWIRKGLPITIFLGDYNFFDLRSIGIVDIFLKKVLDNDVSVHAIDPGRGREMASVFHELKSDVLMPTNYYIQLKEKSIFSTDRSGYSLKPIYWNRNSEDLGIFIDYDADYSPNDRPRILVLPLFREATLVVEKILKKLSETFPQFLAEIPSSDWLDSEDYYPSVVRKFDEQIESIELVAQEKIDTLENQKSTEKEKYKNLRGILSQTGDNLKLSVVDVLRNVLKLSVEDSDDSASAVKNEDIVIAFDGQSILAEVKGVKAENPSPLFIGQVWKHISQNRDKDIVKGALILNHDLATDPKSRNQAYKGEYEKGLEDIIFIDTRVLFAIAIAVLDHGMLPENAAKILFQNGRVVFNLDEYIQSKVITK